MWFLIGSISVFNGSQILSGSQPILERSFDGSKPVLKWFFNRNGGSILAMKRFLSGSSAVGAI